MSKRKIVFAILIVICIIGVIGSLISNSSNTNSNSSTLRQDSLNEIALLKKFNPKSFCYKNDLALFELARYYYLSKKYNEKSPQDSLLIKSFLSLYLDTVSKLIDSVQINKNYLSLPASSEHDSVLKEDSVSEWKRGCTQLDLGLSNMSDTDSRRVPYPKFIEVVSLCRSNMSIYDKVKLNSVIANYNKTKAIIAGRHKALANKIYEEQEEKASNARNEYGEKLRNNYLDKGLDIKVSVYGTNNTIIKLTYALYNDVWSHKMSKGDLIQEIQQMGFKKLQMSDGYEWGCYWDFK